MPSPGEIIDLGKLFERTFGGKPYVVKNDGSITNDPGEVYRVTASSNPELNGKQVTAKGSLLAEQYKGVEIFLPIKLFVGTAFFTYMPYCILKISGKKTIIKTALPERVGTVKEQYNIDDYSISIKGFLVGDDQQFPEDQINNLKALYEAKTAVTIDNAITNIFLTNRELDSFEQRRVVITSFDLPEVQGGRKNVRPFTMELESDSVFTLELAE